MSANTIDLLSVAGACRKRELGPADFGVSGDWTATHQTLRGGLREGVETIEVRVGELKFVVVPTRGMSLWKAWRGDFEFGWQSPVRGPVYPGFVDLGEPSGLGWLDGFDELLVRCGLESNGAPEFDVASGRLKYPLHGRIANRPAQEVTISFDPEREELAIRGVVEETRFHFQKLRMTTTYLVRIGDPTIRIRDEVLNFSQSSAEMQMLYHINFGKPLLDGGSQIVAPIEKLVPRNAHAAEGIATWHQFADCTPGFAEQVYFVSLYGDELGSTHALLKNAIGDRGVSVIYDVQHLPCFSIWKNTTSESDGYVTGLEPATNYPNPRSFEGNHDRVVKLAPGGQTTFELAIEMHTRSDEVAKAEEAIDAIRKGRKLRIETAPDPSWCS